MEAFHDLVEHAAQAYLEGENIQVITPRKEYCCFSAERLNAAIKEVVNPSAEDTLSIDVNGSTFYHNDRVIICKNDRDRNIWNGDMGYIQIWEKGKWYLRLLNGRSVMWPADEAPDMKLAYAITVHKAQGSEFDKVFLPLSADFSHMLTRNLLFTGMSRARKNLQIYSTESVLESCMKQASRRRNSNLTNLVKALLAGEQIEIDRPDSLN